MDCHFVTINFSPKNHTEKIVLQPIKALGCGCGHTHKLKSFYPLSLSKSLTY